MSITIVEGCVDVKWVPINPSATIYTGSIVTFDQSALATSEGCVVRGAAVGVSNTTNKDTPFGVVLGNNLRNPIFSSTYNASYITDEGVTGIRSSTTEYVNVEGPWPKGGKQAMVQVGIIGPGTVLKAPIRNAAIGTAISLLTSTAGNANGLTVTTNACDFTPVAGLGTIYSRTGVNAGQYRVTDDTSATIAAWDREMLNTTATAGETYVRVPLRPMGTSYVIIGDGTVASFIDASASPATNYDIIHVLELNLEEAGNEFVKFRFDNDAFCTNRA
jgi:hypothetical protein